MSTLGELMINLGMNSNNFNSQILKSQNSIKSFESQLNRLKNAVNNSDMSLHDSVRMNEQLRVTQNELRNMQNEFQRIIPNINNTSRSMANLRQSMQNIGSSMVNVGSSMKSAGMSMTQYITRPIIGLGQMALKTTMEFEASMSKVQATCGATGKDFQDLTNLARRMGIETKFTASEAGEALYFMASAGWKTKEMLGGLPGVLDLAAAAGEDLGLASSIATDTLAAFGMKAKDAGRLADVLSSAAANSNTNVKLMGQSLKYAAPVAGSLGYSLEDTAKAMGLMANAGIKSSQAGTAIRGGLTNLVKPTKQMQAAMDKYGITIKKSGGGIKTFNEVMVDLRKRFKGVAVEQKTAAVAAIFGKYSMSGWLAVINASEKDFKKLGKATTEYEGTAKRMAKTMLNNLAGQIKVLKSSLQELGIQISNIMLPYIKKLASYFLNTVNNLGKLNPSMQRLVIIVGLVAASIGPLIVVAGVLISSIGSIIGVLAGITLPMIATAAAIAGITVAIGLLSTAFLKAKFGSVPKAFNVISSKAIEMGKNIKLGFQFFSDGLKGLGDPKALNSKKANESKTQQDDSGFKKIYDLGAGIKKNIFPILEKLKKMFMTSMKNIDLTALMKSFTNLKNSLSDLYVTLKPILKIFAQLSFIQLGIILAAIPPIIQAVITSISMLIETFNIASGIVSVFAAILTGDFSSIPGIFNNIWNSIKSMFINGAASLVGSMYGFINNVIGIFTGEFNTLPQSAAGVWKMVLGNLEDAYNSIVSGLKSFGSTLYSLWLTIWNGLKSGLTTGINGIVSGISTAGSWISSTWNTIWNGIKNTFFGIVNGIVGIFTWLRNTAITIVMGMVNGIINFWTWLYNHNYYFEALVNFIISKFNLVKTTAIMIWNTIVTNVTTIWNTLYNTAISVFNTITTFISTNFNTAKSIVISIWNTISSILTSIWNSIKSVAISIFNSFVSYMSSIFNSARAIAISIWNSIKSSITSIANTIKSIVITNFNALKNGISNALNSAKSTVSRIFNGIKKIITNLVNQAYKWGSNLIGNFTKGVTSRAEQAQKAAEDVATKMWRMLGFHSPTKEGPGKTADKWAPAFIKMYAKGISSKSSVVKNAVLKIAKSMDMNKAKSMIKKVLFDVKDMDNTGIQYYFSDLGYKIKTGFKGVKSQTNEYLSKKGLVPNAMKNFAVGIAKNSPLVKNAVSKIAKSMNSKKANTLIKKVLFETKDLDKSGIQYYFSDLGYKIRTGFKGVRTDTLKYVKKLKILKGAETQINKSSYLKKFKTEILSNLINLDESGVSDFMSGLTDKIKSAFEAIRSKAKEYMDFTDIFNQVEKGSKISGVKLFNNLVGQVGQLKAYQTELSKFGKRVGTGSLLYNKIADMGVGAMDELKALNVMDSKKLQQYSKLYGEKSNVAKQLATSDYNRQIKNEKQYNDIIFNITGQMDSNANIDKIANQIIKKLKVSGIY